VIGPATIAALLPHGGAMVLLDLVVRWDASIIVCEARSHLDPTNPLRRAGRLSAVAGIEYGLQATAMHGALHGGGTPQPAGYLASLRDVVLHQPQLDDPSIGTLQVTASLERRENGGLLYNFDISAADGRQLISGRAAIALPRPS